MHSRLFAGVVLDDRVIAPVLHHGRVDVDEAAFLAFKVLAPVQQLTILRNRNYGELSLGRTRNVYHI